MHVCKRIVLSLFFAASILSYIFWIANTVRATPLDVCPSGCTYSIIQDAVDSAMPSDIINVSEGTYAENVVISKTLTIQGADANTTIVDGTDTDSVFIINSGIAVTLTNMTITNGNSVNTSLNGGGIHIGQADVALIDVIISNNRATNVGGGVYSFGGNLRILNSQLLNNIVADDSGSSFGGGIYGTNESDIFLVNTTVVSNTAFWGGGVVVHDTEINLKNALIAFNVPDDCASTGFPVQSLDHNLDSDNSCNLTETNDLPATDPKISPLQNNGGRTETHALLEDSPAINAGANLGCPNIDQRGVLRPQGSACDIGAYEFEEGITFKDFLYLPMVTKQ